MYYTADGTEVTKDQIIAAVEDGRAVITWSHGEWENVASLQIYDDAGEAELAAKTDTRGKTHSMWDETWCNLADLDDALRAAKGLLVVS